MYLITLYPHYIIDISRTVMCFSQSYHVSIPPILAQMTFYAALCMLCVINPCIATLISG